MNFMILMENPEMFFRFFTIAASHDSRYSYSEKKRCLTLRRNGGNTSRNFRYQNLYNLNAAVWQLRLSSNENRQFGLLSYSRESHGIPYQDSTVWIEMDDVGWNLSTASSLKLDFRQKPITKTKTIF